jgi:hypothetical protein
MQNDNSSTTFEIPQSQLQYWHGFESGHLSAVGSY